MVGGPEKDNFCHWDALNSGLRRARADGSPLAVAWFDLWPDEAVYGLGGMQVLSRGPVRVVRVGTRAGSKNAYAGSVTGGERAVREDAEVRHGERS